MKAEDREALISLVEDINNAMYADNDDCASSLVFGSTGRMDYLEMPVEAVWNSDWASMDDVLSQLEDVFLSREREAQAALKCLKDMNLKGYYKQFQKLDDEEE